jgi:hypothetical protein
LENVLRIIADLIEDFDPENPNFRPTEIYNENWLLKGFLHQASEADLTNSAFLFSDGASWFSEALLPTAFQARYRGDKLAESRTNADGVIGHFLIGAKAKADLELEPGASQFVVIEAKISAPLSSGTSNAPGFDQAARNLACMAEVLRRANIPPAKLDHLAFVVLAPAYSIDAGIFSDEMDPIRMKEKIKYRVSSYEGELDAWFENWAEPTLSSVSLITVSWEQAISDLSEVRPMPAASLQEFYELCLSFN